MKRERREGKKRIKMNGFDTSKRMSLSNIHRGVDFSPKGSIDVPVVELVDFINGLSDFYTTSSCSGRVSLYVDHNVKEDADYSNMTKGISWILVKHRVVTKEEVKETLNRFIATAPHKDDLVSLKCEAFILHVCCRNMESAKTLHQIALGG